MNTKAMIVAGSVLALAACSGKKKAKDQLEQGPPPWELMGEEVAPEDIPEGVKVEMGVPAVEGELDDDAVRGALRPQLEDMARCYERRLALHCKIKGNMRMELEVSRKGPVMGITVLSDTTRDTRLGDCITAIVKKADFGTSSAESTVTATYIFDPPEGVKCE
jgi:hypothetical protein